MSSTASSISVCGTGHSVEYLAAAALNRARTEALIAQPSLRISHHVMAAGLRRRFVAEMACKKRPPAFRVWVLETGATESYREACVERMRPSLGSRHGAPTKRPRASLTQGVVVTRFPSREVAGGASTPQHAHAQDAGTLLPSRRPPSSPRIANLVAPGPASP